MDQRDEVLGCEQRLLRLGPAFQQADAEALLADEFQEFGASGRIWTRSQMLEALSNASERSFVMGDVRLQQPSPDSVLLTYRLSVAARQSLRSSLWIHRHGRWQMLFHQGTLVPPTAICS